MSIQTEITRLTNLRNKIRTALVGLGLAQNTATLFDCASAIEGIENRGGVSVQVREGESYTIPKGYHNGAGTVLGVSGGGNYTLQSKTVAPTKSQQSITSDDGYYGLDSVTVEAIPASMNDTSNVTAVAAHVLNGEIFVGPTGAEIAGTMPNKGKVTATIDGLDTMSYTIPAGYHNGQGTVTLTGDIETALAAI